MFININSKREHEPDLVLQVCNPSYMGDEAEGRQFKACMDYKNGFEASLGNSVRPYLNKVKRATALIYVAFATHTLSPRSNH